MKNQLHYKATIVGGIISTLRELERLDLKLQSRLKMLAQVNEISLPQWKTRALSEAEKQHLIACALEFSQLHPESLDNFCDTALVGRISENLVKGGR